MDNTGTTEQRTPTGIGCAATDPGYPTSLRLALDHRGPDRAPIYAPGRPERPADGLDLPDGRYLISVLADGYKIDGAHFTMPLPTPGPVEVGLQPNPLPDSTLRGQVFADIAPTNGTHRRRRARRWPGFQGHINDTLGEVQTDVYGNPLCTTYVGENPVTHEIPLAGLDADMLPVVDQVGRQVPQRRRRAS